MRGCKQADKGGRERVVREGAGWGGGAVGVGVESGRAQNRLTERKRMGSKQTGQA